MSFCFLGRDGHTALHSACYQVISTSNNYWIILSNCNLPFINENKNLQFLFQGHIDMVHFLLEHGANLNLTARCGAPVASSTSTVLAVARSSSTTTNKEFQDGKIGNLDFS